MSSARSCAIGGSTGIGKCGELLCRPVAISVSSNSITDQKKHHRDVSSSKHQAPPRSSCGVNRRDAMLQMVVASSVSLLSCPATPAAMAAADVLDDFRVYTDETNKFSISIPRDWKVGTGESDRIKLVTAFYPEEVPTSNISVVITGIGPDFTRLMDLIGAGRDLLGSQQSFLTLELPTVCITLNIPCKALVKVVDISIQQLAWQIMDGTTDFIQSLDSSWMKKQTRWVQKLKRVSYPSG